MAVRKILPGTHGDRQKVRSDFKGEGWVAAVSYRPHDSSPTSELQKLHGFGATPDLAAANLDWKIQQRKLAHIDTVPVEAKPAGSNRIQPGEHGTPQTAQVGQSAAFVAIVAYRPHGADPSAPAQRLGAIGQGGEEWALQALGHELDRLNLRPHVKPAASNPWDTTEQESF